MKKDVTIYFKDDTWLKMSGVNTENGISGTGTDKWIVCADMYGNAYTIATEDIKYIKVAPHEEGERYAEKHD